MKAASARTCCFSFVGFVFTLLVSQTSLAQFQGKIFTTPEERAYLDALRQDFLKRTEEQGFDIDKAEPPPLPVTETEQPENTTLVEYTLGGIMTRSDGSRTVWLNNQPVAEASLPANMSLLTEGSLVMLRITVDATRYQLKPGQTLIASTGEIQEAWQRISKPVEAAGPTTTSSDAEAEDSASQESADDAQDNPLPASAAPEASTEGDSSEAP